MRAGFPAAEWAGAPSGRGLGPGVNVRVGVGAGDPSPAPPHRYVARAAVRETLDWRGGSLCARPPGPARVTGAPRTGRIRVRFVRRRAPCSQGWAATESFQRPEGRRGGGARELSWSGAPLGSAGTRRGQGDVPRAALLPPPRGQGRGRCPGTLPGALTWAQRRLGGTPGPGPRRVLPLGVVLSPNSLRCRLGWAAWDP